MLLDGQNQILLLVLKTDVKDFSFCIENTKVTVDETPPVKPIPVYRTVVQLIKQAHISESSSQEHEGVTVSSDVLSGGETFAADARNAMSLVQESVRLRGTHLPSVLNSNSFWSKEILLN